MKKNKTIIVIACVFFVLLVSPALTFAAGSRQAAAPGLEQVNFRLDWLPSAYHAPVFVALERGYWEEEGLSVDVRFGEGSILTAQLVAGGGADVGWANLTVMASAIQEGLPLRSIYGIYQRNALGVMVLEQSGIRSARDLEGRSIVVTGTGEESVLIPLWLAFNDANADAIRLINIESREARRAMFLRGEVDAMWETGFSNVPVLQAQTQDRINFVSISEGDRPMALLLQGIIAHTRTIEQRPDMLRGFVAGLQRGFEYSIENPGEAIDIMMARVPEMENRELLLGILVNSFDLLQTDNTAGMPLGYYSPEDWVRTVELLDALGRIQRELPLEAYYTNEFITR